MCPPGGDEGPPLPTRLMAGLALLKHKYDLSDEALCDRWIENPYFQFFCGEEFFQHRLPFYRSSLTRWRQRMAVRQLQWVPAPPEYLNRRLAEAGEAWRVSDTQGRIKGVVIWGGNIKGGSVNIRNTDYAGINFNRVQGESAQINVDDFEPRVRNRQRGRK